MGAKRAMNTAAFNAQHNAQVDGDPFSLGFRIAVSAPAIALVVVSHYLKKFRGVIFKAIAIRTDIGRSCTDRVMPMYATDGICIGR